MPVAAAVDDRGRTITAATYTNVSQSGCFGKDAAAEHKPPSSSTPRLKNALDGPNSICVTHSGEYRELSPCGVTGIAPALTLAVTQASR